jgi:hypothetical protein
MVERTFHTSGTTSVTKVTEKAMGECNMAEVLFLLALGGAFLFGFGGIL